MNTRTNALTTIIAMLAMTIGTLALTTAPAPAAAPAPATIVTVTAKQLDRDCGDFSNQAAAQDYFISRGGPNSDPDGLDADGDGVACESNPCPCSTDQGGGGGGGTPPPSEPTLPPRKIDNGRIIRVIDGDTVEVRVNGRKVDVRMIGIDTPEVFGGVECGGKQASRFLTKRLPKGTKVKLVSDRTQDLKDRFGRQLRYVFKNGRKDMNKAQVTVGNATVYVYQGKKFERFNAYSKAEDAAKRNNRGIWKNCR